MKRRRFLQSSLLLGATLPGLVACGGGEDAPVTTTPRVAPPPAVDPLLAADAFRHGVASGDPADSQLILWTALTPADAAVDAIPVTLEYVLSGQRLRDEAAWARLFEDAAQVRRLGQFLALKARDYTVKVDLGNVALYADAVFAMGAMQPLPPATWVYYRFRAGSQVSRIGRARTLASGRVEHARFAVASCSNLPEGYFSVYEMISQQDDLDFVLHLGDYIYEYGEDEYGDGSALVRDGQDRVPEPAHEMVAEQDYVLRHAQYKRDRELQRLHARFPLIAVWDDHEITNDSWRDGAENHSEGAEGSYIDRKRHAIRAYFNWMPLRERFPRQGAGLLPDAREVIYRRIRVGDLMDLVMLDTRIIGRDQQLTVPADPARNDPARSLLGDAQRQWLQLQLLLARNEGALWTFLGQQVMFGQLDLVSLPQLKVLGQKLLGSLVSLNMDQWDGYVAERDRVREFVRAIGLQNLVVLTGDIHTSWAIELYENPFILAGANGVTEQPFGVELVAPSVTSPGFPDGAAELVSPLIPVANPHIKYNELKTHGYVLVDLSRERMAAEWRYAVSITDPARIGVENEAMRRRFEVAVGSNRLTATEASVSAPALPGAPPDPAAATSFLSGLAG